MADNNTQVAVIRPEDERITRLDNVAKKAAIINPESGNPFSDMIRTANAFAIVRAGLTDEIMKPILQLQGSKLGFKTDQDREGGYPPAIVKDCVVEAVIHGLPIIGNCFNIIAGNFYMTKEGVLYKLNHVEGLTYEIDPGFPEIVKEASWGTDSRGKSVAVPGEAHVKVRVSWMYGDNKGERDLSYQIKVQNRMTPDAICGKAICRAAKWLHAKVLGLEAPVTEDGAQVIDVTPAKKPPVEPVKPSKSSDRLRAACKVEDAQVVPGTPSNPGDTSSLRSDAADGSTLL